PGQLPLSGLHAGHGLPVDLLPSGLYRFAGLGAGGVAVPDAAARPLCPAVPVGVERDGVWVVGPTRSPARVAGSNRAGRRRGGRVGTISARGTRGGACFRRPRSRAGGAVGAPEFVLSLLSGEDAP